jgi:glycosyltransferase involved in cell wall biosynthesis
MTPTVSVVMSVFNAEPYLRQAVESILRQTLRDFEFIIVDDGSTDRSRALLDEYRDERIIRADHAANRGIPQALNHGLERARGRYVARIDADDVALPERLATQVEYLERHPDIGILGSAFYRLEMATGYVRVVAGPSQDADIRWQIMFYNTFCSSSVMFRRELIATIGGYNETMRCAIDYDLWVRMVGSLRAANLPDALAVYRVHGEGVTGQWGSDQQRYSDAISLRQLRRLLDDGSVPDAALERARDVYLSMFRGGGGTVGREQMEGLALLLRLLRRHCLQEGTAAAPVRCAVRPLFMAMLMRTSLRRRSDWVDSGLLREALRVYPSTLFRQAVLRVAPRLIPKSRR